MTHARKAVRLEGQRAGHAPGHFMNKQRGAGLIIAVLALPMVLAMIGPAGGATLGGHCVLALDPAMDAALVVAGTADVTSYCGLASNSSSDTAILVAGSLSHYGQPLQAHGHIATTSAGTIAYEAPPRILSGPVVDPYAGVLTGLQADPSCSPTGPASPLPPSPLPPGRYCGGITINGNIDFQPGLFVLDGGGLKIVGGGDIRGPGVTFVLTASDASDLGSFDVSGGGLLELRSPTAAEAAATGGYEGMLFIQDPYVPNLDTAPLPKQMLTGGTNMQLDGVLYFPNTEVVYTSGSYGDIACRLIVSRKVTFAGIVYLENDATACAEAGIGSGVH